MSNSDFDAFKEVVINHLREVWFRKKEEPKMTQTYKAGDKVTIELNENYANIAMLNGQLNELFGCKVIAHEKAPKDGE